MMPPQKRSGTSTAKCQKATPIMTQMNTLTPPRMGQRSASGHTSKPPTLGARLGLDEPAADRVAGQLDAVAHAELLEDVRPVALDGLLADHERLGDLVAGVPLGDQLDDLELARGQRVRPAAARRARALEEVADQRASSPPGRGTARRACAARQASTRSRSAADLST